MINLAFIITSTGWGGLEMNTLKLARLLKEKGYNLTLISTEKSTINTKEGGIFSSIELIEKPKKYFDFSSAKKIGKFLKKKDIQITFVFDNKDLDVVTWTKRLFAKNTILIYQQHMQIGINKKDLLHTFRYKAIDKWISPLEYLKNEVAQRTRFSPEKIEVIPLGVELERYTNIKKTKAEARNELSIKTDTTLFGIIGRISPKKGQLFLVNAIIELAKNNIDIELLIFGSATVNDTECQEYEHLIKNTVKESGLSNKIHFIPHQEDPSVFYRAIDCFVLASESETYGMVTIEAMLSGVPIIATKSGGTSEILKQGELGLLYTYEDFDSFQTQINTFLGSKEQMLSMAKEAKLEASRKFDQDKEASDIDGLIKDLIKDLI